MTEGSKRTGLIAGGIILALVLMVAIATQFVTLLAVQPIGAIPDGVTAVIWRTDKTKFIDSADAICKREFGKVNLLCRGATLAALARRDEPLLRLPYSKALYSWSTGGAEYDR